MPCIFCAIPADRLIAENELASAFRDGFPVTEGHTLVIPKRHVTDWFYLSEDELMACNKLLAHCRTELLESDTTIRGFNVGANVGEVAGQTVFHCHIHLIPRREGDVPNPRGGVRNIIPGKGDYKA